MRIGLTGAGVPTSGADLHIRPGFYLKEFFG